MQLNPPQVAGAVAAQPTPTDWASALLGRLGYPATPANVSAIVAWEAAEGGHWHNNASYNPLNTTQGAPDAVPINSVGVKAYSSWDEGLTATVQTLQNGYYPGVLAALSAGSDPYAVSSAVGASPWGTGDFRSVLGSVLAGRGYDPPTPSGGATTVAYVPGTHFHIPGTGAGGGLVPDLGGLPNPISGAASAAKDLGALVTDVLHPEYIIEFVLGVAMVWVGVNMIRADLANRPTPAVVAAARQSGSQAQGAYYRARATGTRAQRSQARSARTGGSGGQPAGFPGDQPSDFAGGPPSANPRGRSGLGRGAAGKPRRPGPTRQRIEAAQRRRLGLGDRPGAGKAGGVAGEAESTAEVAAL
jgi:hypothetical protein